MNGRPPWGKRGRQWLSRWRPVWDRCRRRLAAHGPPPGWGPRVGWAAEWLRNILLPIAFVLGADHFVDIVAQHYPIKEWLFWRYAGYWIGSIVFSLACLGGGVRVLQLVGASRWGIRERLVFSFPLGLLVFGLTVFVAGVMGQLTQRFFWVLPLALIIMGGLPLYRLLRGGLRLLRLAGRGMGMAPSARRPLLRDRLLAWAVMVVLVVGLLLIYVTVITPDNTLFDARWYHLGMADHYARARTIERFPEGWYMAAFPQLATYVYSWGFLVPGRQLFDQIGLCAHLEFMVLLWTLAGVGVLTRRLVPHAHPRYAFVVMLLFPGLYLYDSSLGMGADHVAAMWAPVIFLGLLRAWRDFAVSSWTVTAAAVSGAALTKYTAASLMLFPLLALGGAVVFKLVRLAFSRPRAWSTFKVPGIAMVTGVVLTAPHWLKNWLWYGNPVYPLAAEHFDNRPWSPEAALRFTELTEANAWVPQGTFLEKIQETLWALWEFSFEPHDWPRLHGKVPVFGSLFTLSMLALVLLKRTRRVWALAVATHVGIFFWYWTQHEDRYLQAMLPWMAAVTAAVVALVWRTHVVARVAALGLIGLQLVWGGDVYLIPAHRMLAQPPVKKTIELVSSGYQRKYEQRFEILDRADRIDAILPDNARVLLHEHNPRLGMGAFITTDTPFQAGLIYGTMKSPREIFERLVDMNVTHVAWHTGKSKGWDSLASDLLFFDFIRQHVDQTQTKGMWTTGVIFDADDPPHRTDDVLYLGCEQGYRWGIYPRTSMRVSGRYRTKHSKYPAPRVRLRKPEEAAELLGQVQYVVHHRTCFRSLPAQVSQQFDQVTERSGRLELWIRKP